MAIFFLLFTLIGLSEGQQFLPFSDFTTSFDVELKNVEIGMKLYVSCISSNTEQLQNYVFTSGKETKTGYELVQSYQDQASGLKAPWVLPAAQVTVSNRDNTAVSNMAGFVYILSAEQSKDPSFYVYDVFGTQTIDRSSDQNSTIVMLPRMTLVDFGFKDYAATLTNFNMRAGSAIQIYRDYPSANLSANLGNKVFANPMDHVDLGTMFFYNVDPLQISYPAFHIVASGGIYFQAHNSFTSSTLPKNATSTTVTGLIMNRIFTANSTIYYQPDHRYNGYTGYKSTLRNVLAPVVVQLNEFGSYVWNENFTSDSSYEGFDTQTLADAMYVWPMNMNSGFYSFQYYQIQTTPKVMTTMHVVTANDGSTTVPTKAMPNSTISAIPTVKPTQTPLPTTPQVIPTTTKLTSFPSIFLASIVVLMATNLS
ncbi:unnamed protein product [Caenorhabditis auriculariae]|uniref:CUB-like domain-containing protein n=1 Tax=Caenorhabditis auriculariae TaxID=2777116 RepID=A0A8S1HWU8_9PELO|nr:unnamed protein product [Caenorhabditis auriculariae]